MTRIFSAGRPREFLDREEQLLDGLHRFLAEMNWNRPAEKLQGLREGLTDPFSIVVVGEYNTGKSCFINAVLGERLLSEGVLPTTDRITVVCHRDEKSSPARDEVKRVFTASEALRDIHFIDTPGTNSIIQEHREITESFIHRAELVLFVLSGMQPFAESERLFLEFIRGRWDRKVVFLVNKVDLLRTQERPVIRDYVSKNAYKLLHFEPLLFLLSAREGLEAKLASDPERLQCSGLPAVERYIFDTLSSDEKILLKLRSPLKAASHIADEGSEELREQIACLRRDEERIERLLSQVRDRQREVKDFFEKYRSEIDRVFYQLRDRVHSFIRERLRSVDIARMRILGRRLEDEFRREVLTGAGPLASLPSIIEESIDYVTRNNRKQWEFCLTYVREHFDRAERLPGWDTDFEERRRHILETTRRSAERFQSFDVDFEADHIRQAAEAGLQRFLLFEGIAVASGVGLTAVLSTTLLDLTGLAFAAAIGLYGFFVLPRKRQQAMDEFDRRLSQLSDGFKDTLTRQLERAVDHVTEEIEQNLSPLLGLCRQERLQAEERAATLADFRSRLAALSAELERELGDDS